MATKKTVINICTIGEEALKAEQRFALEDPAKRILLALQLTYAAWAIREAKGDRVPTGLERVFNIIE